MNQTAQNAGRKMIGPLFLTDASGQEKIDFWTVVRNQLQDRPRRNRTSWFSTGRWVLAGATVTATILLIVPLVKPTPKRITFDVTTVNPVIHTLSLAEKPARLVYFKVDNPGRLIVWASSSDLSPQEEIKNEKKTLLSLIQMLWC
jgi:hypothetical protein